MTTDLFNNPHEESHKILALDAASELGWAIFANGITSSGTEKFVRRYGRKKLPDEHPGVQLANFQKYLKSSIREYKITHIAHEEPAGQASAMKMLYGYRGIIYAEAARLDIPVLPIYPSTLKKWATGKGNADKSLMIKGLEQHGFYVDNDNEADALWLLLWAREQIENM